MAKAIPHLCPRQAGVPQSAALRGLSPASLGPTLLTPECGYSLVEGLLYCHVVDEPWWPGDPLLLDFEADYRPLVANIHHGRRLLLRELRQTISPRRKRMIRIQRAMLAAVVVFFEPLAELAAGGNS